MAVLIREQPADILNRREWWSLSDSCEAIIAFGKDVCSIHVTNMSQEDITKELFEKIDSRTETKLSITATIDSYFIECELGEEKAVMEAIESYLNE